MSTHSRSQRPLGATAGGDDHASGDRRPRCRFRQLASLFRQYRISACPVINAAGQVLGVVSEADLLHKAADTELPAGLIRLQWKLSQQSKATAVTAAQLMTSPAVTINAEAPGAAAAKIMQDRCLKRLPVADDRNRLAGIISRVDVLSVYDRPDSDIIADVRRIIGAEFALKPADGVRARIRVPPEPARGGRPALCGR